MEELLNIYRTLSIFVKHPMLTKAEVEHYNNQLMGIAQTLYGLMKQMAPSDLVALRSMGYGEEMFGIITRYHEPLN